jgi:exodeoxyribonuclease V gamma subunit
MTAVLAEHAPERLHLFALSPSEEYWADCATRGRGRKARMPEMHTEDRGEASENAEPSFYPGGMLWAFGRSSQDLHRQLSDSFLSEGDGGSFCESPPPADSLLGRLQLSCRRSAPLGPDERLTLAHDDASLTVHSCHSTLRELEVCRDRILQAREEMPDLRYEDILLLLADPKRQAPFVEAALRTNDASHGGLPYRLQGSGQAVTSALTEGVSLLLEKIPGRLGLADLQVLIEHPLIGAKFGFRETLEDGQNLVSWLADANFRWGIDPAHRASFQEIHENRWNLCWALQRLGLGSLVNEEQVGSILPLQTGADPTVPLERAAGLSLKGLAQLARFAKALQASRNLWNHDEPLPMSEWNTRLRALVDTFIDCRDPGASQHFIKLNNTILPALEKSVPESNPPLTADAYLRLLEEKLVSIGESGARGPGGICVADLKHYAGVPARMILIAGLDDGAFPGNDDRPSWNPLSQSRKTGDPSKRDGDRHAFLLAVLGCRDRLVLSYQGRSDEDSKERPPSTALADLLQVVDQTLHPDAHAKKGTKPHKQITFEHPLNGFSPKAFSAAQHSSARSRLSTDGTAAQVLNEMSGLPPFAGLWTRLLPPENESESSKLSLNALQQLVREPARIFLERLGVRLPETPEELESGDLLKLNSLKKWSLRDRLLSAFLEGGSEPELLAYFCAAGDLPRGTIGRAVATDLLEELPRLAGEPFRPSDRINRTIQLTLKSPETTSTKWTLEGQLRSGWYLREGTKTAHFYSASKRGLKNELQLCLDALLLSASFEKCPALAPDQVQFCFQNVKKPASIKLPDPEAARTLLESLLPLYRAARCLPLPFWPATAAAILKGVAKLTTVTWEDIQTALNAGFFEWTNGPYGLPADAELESTRYAFRGCANPLLWTPALPPGHGLAESGHPLAWRLAEFFNDWKKQAGLS